MYVCVLCVCIYLCLCARACVSVYVIVLCVYVCMYVCNTSFPELTVSGKCTCLFSMMWVGS